MKKILSCMGALLALCLTFSVSAQTLLYDAAGSGTTFAKVGGTQDYTLNLNGNVVLDGNIVMTATKNAVEIASANLENVTVVMLVSNISTTIEGQFMAIGRVGLRTVLPALTATAGGVKGTFNENVWGNVGTVNLPTNLSTTTVTYAYSKATGSTSYINGAQSFDAPGLKDATYTTANILLGGKSKASSDNLNVGMLIHRVQIYDAKLNVTQVATAEATIKAAIETPDAPLFTPVVPVADNGKWYFVKSQRSAGAEKVSSAMNVPNWWTVQEDGQVVPGTLTRAENQQFQVVTASGGKVTFKIKDGEKTMSLSGEYYQFTGTTAVTEGWTITPKTINEVQGVNLPGQYSGIHQSESTRGYKLMNWYGENDNSTFFFYEETPDFSFRFAIEDARALVGTAFVGTDLGCVPQEAIDTYKVAIKAAEALLGNTDAEAIAAATTALTAATTAFRAAKVALNTSPDEPTYYYIVSKNDNNYSNGQVIYTTGATTQCMWGPKTTPTLNMLFRFEKHEANNTYRIINAAFPYGNLVGVNNGTDPTYLTIEELTGANGPQFWIKKGSESPFHAQGAGNKVVSYNGGYGTASAWTFAPVEGGIASIFQAQYDALVIEYAAMVDNDGNATSAYPLGTAVGQYNETMFGTMKTAYAAMVADMTDDGATLTATIGATTTAIAAFKASQVQPYAFNGPIGMTAKYTLQYVNSASSKNNYYLKNPRTNDDEEPRVHTTLSAEYDAHRCDWRFLPSLTNRGKFILWNDRGDNKKEYFDEELRMCTGTTKDNIDDNQWTTKTLLQSEVTWNFGTSYLVIKIDENSNYFYVNDTNGDVRRNDKNYSFFKLTLLNATTVDEATQSVRATVVNGTIEVGGAQTIDVYTITGLQVENKNLKPGVYVAKANGVTYKVAVK